MTNLKTVKATIWIMLDGKKHSSAVNMGGVADELNELVENEGKDVLGRVSLVNVLNEVHNIERLGMVQDEDIVTTGELNLSDPTYEYVIDSGDWYGKEFDDEDELKEFFKDKMESGEVTAEEVQQTDIIVKMYQNATLEDAEAEPGAIWFDEDEIKTEGDLMSYRCMGNTFIIEDHAHDALAELDKTISAQKDDLYNMQEQSKAEEKKDIEDMTFEELAEELASLQGHAAVIRRLMLEKSRDDI